MKPEDAEKLIAELVDDWFKRMVDKDRRRRRGASDLWESADQIDLHANDDAEALDEGRLTPFVRGAAAEVLREAGVRDAQPGLDEEQREALAWEIARANVRLLREMAEERRRDVWGEPRRVVTLDTVAPVAHRHGQAAAERRAGVTITEAVEKYVTDKSEHDWSTSYQATAKRYFERFLEHL